MNKLYFIRLIQLILVVLLALIIFMGDMDEDAGLYLIDTVKFAPIILWGGILACGVLDLLFSRKILQLIVLGVFTLAAILMYIDGGMTQLNASIWVLSIMYSPISLYRFAKTKNVKKIESYKERTLPLGFFSIKQLMIMFGSIFSIIVLYLIWVFALNLNPFVGLLLVFVITVIIIYILFVKLNKFNCAIKKINEEAIFNDFKNSLDLLLAENLHPETRGYVKTIYSNYLGSVNKEESIKMFDSITRPNNKIYATMYDTMELLYYIKKKEYETTKNVLTKYRIKYPKNNAFCNNVDLIIQIENTNNIINNVEQSFPINTSFKFQNISNAYTLAYYYKSRNDLNKAIYYADVILSNKSDLEEYNKFANEIKSEIEINNLRED